MNRFNIQPISYGILGQADSIIIDFVNFQLGVGATIRVIFANEEKSFDAKVLEIPSEIYQNWGTDDSVIIDWVCEELGLTEA